MSLSAARLAASPAEQRGQDHERDRSRRAWLAALCAALAGLTHPAAGATAAKAAGAAASGSAAVRS
jgi:hypothetical protein